MFRCVFVSLAGAVGLFSEEVWCETGEDSASSDVQEVLFVSTGEEIVLLLRVLDCKRTRHL